MRECLPVRRRGGKRDDRSSAARQHAAAHEVDLAADGAEIAVARDLGVGLARQVDLDHRIDRWKLGQRRGDREVVRVVDAAHVDRPAALGEVAQPLRSEQPAGDGDARRRIPCARW